MTQSPYVPSSGGQDQDPQSGEWSTTGSGFASSQPDFDPAAPYGQFDEPVTGSGQSGSTATDDLYASTSATTGGSSTKDAAKDEATDLKNTTVDRGQQVAGVAKEQATAVKDNAVGKGQQVAGVAKEQASAVKDTALENAQQVAGIAKGEVSKVTAEATGQFKDLVSQGRTQLTSQLDSQQQRLASVVHSFADELGTMGSKSDGGPLADLAKQGSRRVGEIAHYIETSEPSDVLEQVRNFARRRPAAFLIGSALAGGIVGRLTRSAAADAKDAKQAQSTGYTGSGYSAPSTTTTGYDAGTYNTGGYDAGTYDTGLATPAAGVTGGYDQPSTGSYDDTVTYVEPTRGDSTR